MHNDRLEEFNEEERRLLSRAWDGGPADADLRLLRSLPPLRRAKVVKRLAAMIAIEDVRVNAPRARADISKVAEAAGLTRHGLLTVRAKWEKNREISSLVPYLGREEKQPTQLSDDDPAVVAARALIAAHPGALDGTLAGMLKREHAVTKPRGMRLIRRLRRDDAVVPDRLAGTYGASIVVDLCAIDRYLCDYHGQPAAIVVAVERASGLVIGHRTVPAWGETLTAQHEVVLGAIGFVRGGRLDPRSGIADIALTVGDGDRLQAVLVRVVDAKADGFDVALTTIGPRRYGRRLLALFGRRLGMLGLRPMLMVQDGEGGSRGVEVPSMTLGDVAVHVDRQIALHNEAVRDRLVEAGVTNGGGDGGGAMVAALTRLAVILAP
jgi:hypothetical protein